MERWEDLNRSILTYNSLVPLNLQITHKKKSKDTAVVLSEEKIELFEKGYQSLREEITKNAVKGTYSKNSEIPPIRLECFLLSQDKMSAIKMLIAIDSIMSLDIHDLCNFSIDVQLLFYEIAISFHENADLSNSINAFTFLTIINPDVPAFWIGLALSYEKDQNYDKAIDSFKRAIQVSNPTDLSPYHGLIRCSEAIQDFRDVIQLLENAKNNEAIKDKVIALLEYLKAKR